ncbi:hypothetical protein GCM10011384_44480 [Psychrobacillus lasiicapitis]|nr:hypothetical protein GCM10011384_44480 [Psychrobacillus lasiicapitis]
METVYKFPSLTLFPFGGFFLENKNEIYKYQIERFLNSAPTGAEFFFIVTILSNYM